MLGGKIYEKNLNVGIGRNGKKQTECFIKRKKVTDWEKNLMSMGHKRGRE